MTERNDVGRRQVPRGLGGLAVAGPVLGGATRATALVTTPDEAGAPAPEQLHLGAQKAWLERTLRAASRDPGIDWIIVCMHHGDPQNARASKTTTEPAPWSAYRDLQRPYGFASFDFEPHAPGGHTQISSRTTAPTSARPTTANSTASSCANRRATATTTPAEPAGGPRRAGYA
jgi:hypothetical protein